MSLRRQQGIAVLEFTIMLPVMLLLVYATGEFGRVLHQYSVLTQLTRDAARYVSQPYDTDSTEVVILTGADIDKAKNILLYGKETSSSTPLLSGLTASDITISVVGTGVIVISVTYNWSPIFGSSLPTFGLGDDIDLSFSLRTNYAVRAL